MQPMALPTSFQAAIKATMRSRTIQKFKDPSNQTGTGNLCECVCEWAGTSDAQCGTANWRLAETTCASGQNLETETGDSQPWPPLP